MRQIYTNGRVYTGELPLKEAFIVEDDKFISVGTSEEMLALKEEVDEVIDLGGNFVCAGFNDSHMHLVNFGYSLSMANLAKHTDSMESVIGAMKDFIKEKDLKPGTWAKGRGWNHDYFTDERRFPNRYDLDKASTEHPIVITRTCGHTCVVNSKALEMIGLTGEVPYVEGGRVEVFENGVPNGVFRENAMDLVYSKLPVFSVEDVKEMIIEAMHALNTFGVTSSQTDDLPVFNNVPAEVILQAYKELNAEGKMTVRVNQQAQFLNLEGLKKFIADGYNTGWGDEWFRIGPLKMLGDGSLGARSAYMSEPYADDPTTRGIPIFTRQQFVDMVGYAHNHGMQVAIHAIGDGILDDILYAYEKAIKENPRDDHRHGIVHCQIMRPEQLKKFEELNLHAYIQSIFLDYDIHIVEERVGKERAKSSYNFKTMYDTVHTSNGSDCPVELPNVLGGIQCAVTRMTLDGQAGPYLEDQALDVKEALDSFTIEGAHASFEENIKGKIQEGMLADFVILNENPMEVPVNTIKDIKILGTYVGGIKRF